MNTKLFGLLLSPISRLEAIAVDNNEKLTSIELLTMDVKNIQSDTATELKKQTTILGDIKKLIEESSKDKEKEMAKGAGFKPLSIKETGLAAFMIVGISAAIVASALLFSFIPTVTPMQMLTAALIAVTFVAVAPAFVKIAGVLSKMKGETSASYNGMSMSKVDSSGILPLVAGSLIAMVGISAAIAISSLILQLVVPVHPIKLLTALLIGTAMIGASYAFAKIIENMKGMGMKEVLMATGSLVLISGAIVMSSIILLATAVPSAMQMLSFLLVGAIMIPATYAFSLLLKNMKGMGVKEILLAAASMVLIAGAIVAVGHIFTLYPGDPSNLPGVKFAFLSGLVIFTFSFAFALLARSLKSVSFTDMAKAVVSMALVAIAIVGVAYIFQYLASVGAYVAPPADWALKTGLALVIFSVGFGVIALLTKTLGIQTMFMGLLGTAVVALGILATAWIFSAMPDTFIAPPIDWTLKTMVAMALFAVPITIIGAIAMSGAGAAAILLGVVGMIVIAAGIWVVAWIFSKLPDLTSVSQMLTDALLTPVNGIVDVLARLKNEVGVENLLPLAGGIVAIAGSLLILAGAMAGTAAAGVFQSLGNVVSGVLDFFTGKQTKGPIDILKDLIAIAPSLPKLSQPLDMIANAMNEADITNMVDNLTKIAKAIKATAIQGAQDPNVTTTIDRLRELSKMSFKDQIEDLEAIAKAYNKIADTTNKINVEAMDSTTNMFKALAYLSQNGGKTAIEALGENLIEAVEELANMIADFEGTVKDQSASNRGVAEQFGGLTDSIKSSVGSFFGGGSAEASPAENNAEVARQMRKLVKMLQSGDAKIVIADVNDSAAQKLA